MTVVVDTRERLMIGWFAHSNAAARRLLVPALAIFFTASAGAARPNAPDVRFGVIAAMAGSCWQVESHAELGERRVANPYGGEQMSCFSFDAARGEIHEREFSAGGLRAVTTYSLLRKPSADATLRMVTRLDAQVTEEDLSFAVGADGTLTAHRRTFDAQRENPGERVTHVVVQRLGAQAFRRVKAHEGPEFDGRMNSRFVWRYWVKTYTPTDQGEPRESRFMCARPSGAARASRTSG